MFDGRGRYRPSILSLKRQHPSPGVTIAMDGLGRPEEVPATDRCLSASPASRKLKKFTESVPESGIEPGSHDAPSPLDDQLHAADPSDATGVLAAYTIHSMGENARPSHVMYRIRCPSLP